MWQHSQIVCANLNLVHNIAHQQLESHPLILRSSCYCFSKTAPTTSCMCTLDVFEQVTTVFFRTPQRVEILDSEFPGLQWQLRILKTTRSCFYLNFLFPPQLLFLPILTMCLNGSRNKHYHPNDAEIFLMNTSAFKNNFIKICSARLWELYNTSKPSQENFPNSSHTAMDFWSLWHVYQKNRSLED